MRTLDGQSIPNIITTDPDYPHGRVQDESSPGAGDGTPITELAGIADIYQGVIEQCRLAGVVPDETPEKKSASQIVEAFGWFAPVAVIKVGPSIDDATPRVLSGKYQPGYSATFAYGSHSANGMYDLFQLAIKKGGAVSGTEKYFVTVAPAVAPAIAGTSGTSANGLVVSAQHDPTSAAASYFMNDSAGNIAVAAGDFADVDANDLKIPMIITVHRVV